MHNTYEEMFRFMARAVHFPDDLIDSRTWVNEGKEAPYTRDEHDEIVFKYQNQSERLQHSKLFEMSDSIKKLLTLTDLPDINSEMLELPFPAIFIDVIFDKEDYPEMESDSIHGLMVVPYHLDFSQSDVNEEGIQRAALHTGESEKKSEYWADMFVVYNLSHMGGKVMMNECTITTKTNYNMKTNPINKNEYELIKNFVFNFLIFLNDPEVEYREVKRSDKNRERRISKGKAPMPSSNIINLTGKLLIYLNELESKGSFHFSHRFWVRGHFRTLKAARYKEKRGIRIWVLPYIKGQGMLIEKEYKLNRTALPLRRDGDYV